MPGTERPSVWTTSLLLYYTPSHPPEAAKVLVHRERMGFPIQLLLCSPKSPAGLLPIPQTQSLDPVLGNVAKVANQMPCPP